MSTDRRDAVQMRFAHIKVLVAIIILAATLAGCGSSGGGATSVTIRNTAPSVSSPASFMALASSGSVTLAWSAVTGATSYTIYRSTSPSVTKTTGSVIVSGLAPGVTAYRDTSVTNGETYYYVMTSFSGSVESADSPEVSSTPGSPAGTVQGEILFEDKEYGLGNFTGVTTWKPVRYANVDIVAVGTGSVLYSGQTDSRGKYAITVLDSATSVYVRVNSAAAPPGSGSITVRSLSSNLYGVPSDTFLLSSSAGVSIGITVSNGADGAFNILDVMTTGYDFVRYHDGSYPSVSLVSYWSQGNTLGTFFCYGLCPIGPGIYVLSVTSDTDQFDDDVLWHEFGHFLAYTYSVDQSEGGPHSLSDVDHDLRFSWSEGWGDFLPGAIKIWLLSTDPSRLSTPAGLSPTLYVDTPTFAFDFGSQTLPAQYSYATGETAVAKVLHSIGNSFSMANIWDTFTSFTTAVTATRPANLELFWDQWQLLSKPTSTGGTSMQDIFAERQILYRSDPYESDDALVTAKTITVWNTHANHTLYGDADWDHVQFTPAASMTYTIRTQVLRNGADTYLELYNNFGTLLAWNDNTTPLIDSIPPFNCSPTTGICRENGSDILGSTIQFTSSSETPTGPYIIKVYSTPYPAKPVSAGRYGTYDLRITSP